ncbi:MULTISPECIES: hypothetical protein [Nocardiopsis]|uniref:Uncharacterized protein n=1 Tax=Nocardiopsis sinuspersici TaxID=501010 RepID=A0A1V3BUT2_9ACTN|nr:MULTISPECIES: hypothetical protein [Nocardiopsis]OOC52427.1 hypothetical protein NOSIN_00080 [Nocardiopsis sinuspersici]
MIRTWGTPPEPTAEDHPEMVARQDTRTGVQRCRTGCVAIEDTRGISSDTDSHSFLCHGCGGAVCIGCRTTPVVSGPLFCTPYGNAQAGNYASMGAEDVEVPAYAPITAGQMRALLAGVGDDVPLRALFDPHLKTGMQNWDVVAARHILQGKAPEGPQVRFALYLSKAGA